MIFAVPKFTAYEFMVTRTLSFAPGVFGVVEKVMRSKAAKTVPGNNTHKSGNKAIRKDVFIELIF